MSQWPLRQEGQARLEQWACASAWLPAQHEAVWDVSSGSAQPACSEPSAAHPDPLCLSALQERSLTGYLAWRKGAEQTTSLHRMTPAGPLTTPSGWQSSKESSFLS